MIDHTSKETITLPVILPINLYELFHKNRSFNESIYSLLQDSINGWIMPSMHLVLNLANFT